MCYHISTTTTTSRVETRFGVRAERALESAHSSHLNAFVHPLIPVITNQEPDALQYLEWGLIPSWARPEQAAELARVTLNAKAETLFEKPSFRDSIRHRRCLIVVDGFYEWQHRGKKKQPYRIALRDDEPFALGGIWSLWRDAQGKEVATCSVITTEANELMAEIHNTKRRMPLVLPRQVERDWLEDLPESQVRQLLIPFGGELEAVPIEALPAEP